MVSSVQNVIAQSDAFVLVGIHALRRTDPRAVSEVDASLE
jgi:hypothetical protein